MSYTPIDLSQLPAPDVVEALDFESILEALVADLLARYPQFSAFVESEPGIKLLEVCAYRELLLRQRVNDAARSVMLAYAAAADLDNLAALLGVERQDGESDTNLRERTQIALEGLSTAGPVGAYEYHARSADARVKDVDVSSPSAGEVLATVLSTEGDGTPSQAVLDAVLTALSDETVRPLCDGVSVAAAEIVPYTVAASLELYQGPDSSTVRDTAETAARTYVNNAHRLGIEVTLSGLYAALHVAGVKRVTLTSPAADVTVTAQQAAYCTALTVEVANG